MSTTGKSSIRKDKKFAGISNIFEEQDIKKAALEQEMQEKEIPQTIEPQKENVEKLKENKEKPEKGRGVSKKGETTKKKEAEVLFFKEKRVLYKSKSCYLSVPNIDFIDEMRKANGLAFSDVVNQIIDNFRENL